MIKHAMTQDAQWKPTYTTWVEMRRRCRDPRVKDYKNYGGRGIKVDPRWEDFAAFVDDMGKRPDGTTIDRIDVDGPYCRENCRWATPSEQSNNQSCTIRLMYDGERITLRRCAELSGLPIRLIRKRYYLGWDADRIVEAPYGRHASRRARPS
jgi:hypothetical protein